MSVSSNEWKKKKNSGDSYIPLSCLIPPLPWFLAYERVILLWLLGPMEGSGQLRAVIFGTCSLALIQTSPGQLLCCIQRHSCYSQYWDGHLWPWWPWLTWQGLGHPSANLRALVFLSPSFSASLLVEPGSSQTICALINLLKGEGYAAYKESNLIMLLKEFLNHKGGQGSLNIVFFLPLPSSTLPPSFLHFIFLFPLFYFFIFLFPLP